MGIRKIQISRDPGVHGGKVDLLVIDFGKQDVVPVEFIARAVEILPDAHLEGLEVIKYEPTPGPHANAGEYIGGVKGVILKQFPDVSGFLRVLYHEIGHYVFHEILSSYDRQTWVTQVHKEPGAVSGYARRNGNEDFAESYMFYIIGRPHLSGFPQRFAFMRDVVFQGFEPPAPLG